MVVYVRLVRVVRAGFETGFKLFASLPIFLVCVIRNAQLVEHLRIVLVGFERLLQLGNR